MGGKMPPEWWREYRRRRSEHLRAYNRERRKQPKVKAQRHASEARRRALRQVADEPLPMLYPDLQRGSFFSFWEDELRMDLAQEAELARLEGRCPDEAIRTYRGREMAWRHLAAPLLADQPEGSGGKGAMDL